MFLVRGNQTLVLLFFIDYFAIIEAVLARVVKGQMVEILTSFPSSFEDLVILYYFIHRRDFLFTYVII